jgi:hypothetical protein
VFILGFQVGVFKFVRSSWGVKVAAFCGFLVSIFRRSKPRGGVSTCHNLHTLYSLDFLGTNLLCTL